MDYYKAILMPTIVIWSSIALVYSKSSAVGSQENKNLANVTINSTSLPSTSSTIVSPYSVQIESKISKNTDQLPLPSSSSSPIALSPSSSITFLTSSMPPIINNTKGSPKSSEIYDFSSTLNSTLDSSLSNIDDSVTLVNLNTVTSTSNVSSYVSQLPPNHNQLYEQPQPQSQSNQLSFLSIEFIAISCSGLLILTIITVASVYGCIKVYHKRYPVRIGFGRKFSTFENPIYTQKSSSSCEIDSSRENQAGPTGNEA
ncbi:A-agglutinin anchorage subunit-like [Tetranychus urticae]|uniref:Uncharacterized protein n=1 Tax=Tetranychus urticae TaxID=32264 RepID=T1JZ82_TETUR|nr:A-agglutinin anchorage subunit-like [Tetranychus urticae]